MNCIEFADVRFAYPPVEGDTDENGNLIVPAPIFDHFTAVLPEGFISLVGPNASGKSTFMLLAAGRLLPQAGNVSLFGKNTAHFSEKERDVYASFIYQNMEFETEENTGDLLSYVFENGKFSGRAKAVKNTHCALDNLPMTASTTLLEQLIAVLELKAVLHHKLTGLSKGEMQRVTIAFALLHGSRSIFMDEPMFAMEAKQKEAVLAYLKAYATAFNVTIYISMHELELSRKYSDRILLFYPNRNIDFGTPEEVLTQESLENAYGVPAAMLKDTEQLTRKALQEQNTASAKK